MLLKLFNDLCLEFDFPNFELYTRIGFLNKAAKWGRKEVEQYAIDPNL